MQDINFQHLDALYLPFNEEVAEHFGYLKDLERMDLSFESDATKAIRTWVLPACAKWTDCGTQLIKEALRYTITTLRGGPRTSFWRPGIDELKDETGMLNWTSADARFQMTLWKEVFAQEFVPANTRKYRLRTDSGFRNFPNDMSYWGTPAYEEILWLDV